MVAKSKRICDESHLSVAHFSTVSDMRQHQLLKCRRSPATLSYLFYEQ